MTRPAVSVIIPAHNPHPGRLQRALQCLRDQDLASDRWELLLIDNASDPPLDSGLLAWHPQGRVLREPRLGLSYARLAGLAAARGGLLVWVDDDNCLGEGYLRLALELFEAHPRLGAAGGPALAEYEQPPPAWFEPGLAPLGCRDHGPQPLWMRWDAAQPTYPPAAPIGAGLVIRHQALQQWAEAVDRDPRRQRLGRRGRALSSGEDNDINLTLLRQGWELAYRPELELRHLIPPGRLRLAYQQRLARASFRDFVRVLDVHGLRPWGPIAAWTLPLRALRAAWTHRVWRGPAARIRWAGTLGQYQGRAGLRPLVAPEPRP